MDRLKLGFYLSLLILTTLSFQNCDKGTKSSSSEAPSALQILQTKSLETLNTQCSSCHSGESAYANAVLGSDPITDITNINYLLQSRLIVPGEPELSPLYQKIKNGEMPPASPLSVSDVETIKDWIIHFNDEPGTNTWGGITTIPLAATFESLRVNVFLSKCYTCHRNRAVTLDTYASVSGAITNNNLRGRVANNTMPPANAPQLSSQEKTYLLQWIDAGATP